MDAPRDSSSFDGRNGVRHTPVRHRASGARLAVRHEPKLETSDGVTHVKWLVEVRLLLQDLVIPGLGPGQIRDVIKHRSQSLNHNCLHFVYALAVCSP